MAQLRRKIVSSTIKKLKNPIVSAMNRAKHSGFYHDLSLRGEHPLRLLGTPKDIWSGSVTAGTHMVGQKFVGAGHILENPNIPEDIWPDGDIWRATDLSDKWLEYLHSFDWLKDLNQAVDNIEARKRSEILVETWIDHNTQWGEISWRADIVGRRIINWLTYAPLILDSDDLIYRSRVLDIMARSGRHLYKVSSDFADGPDGLNAIIGMIFAGLYIPSGDKWLKEGINLFKFVSGKEILLDGGIRSRNPHELLRLFMNMVVLRQSFPSLGHKVPEELINAIHHMAGNLRFMIHGDGKLALFNGAYIQNNEDIFSVLLKLDKDDFSDQTSPGYILPQSGFARLERGETVILQDIGPPAELELSRRCHVGALSFEMSRGTQRLIVNCGDGAFINNEALYLASRGTASHSTLMLNDHNSSEFQEDGLIGQGITNITSQKYEENGHLMLDASHDGYVAPYKMMHRRLIYLDERGIDIRGEDILTNISNKDNMGDLPFTVRFHLHPTVTTILAEDENSVIMELADGEKWKFRCRGAELTCEESVYFGEGGKISQSQQIVLSSDCKGKQTKLLWSVILQ